MIRPDKRCTRYACPARRVAYRLCSRHWLQLVDRAHATRHDVARTLQET